MGGSGWNKLVILDKKTKQIEWEYPLEKGWECNSVDFDKKGNILFSYSKGARLLTPEKEIIWDIFAPEACELQTAKALSDGNYLLAWCGNPATIIEVNSQGEIISKTEFDTGIENPHAQFRQVNKNTQGNYLVPLFQYASVWEISPEGLLQKQYQVEGAPFCITKNQNGNYYVACGDAHSFVELNPETGEIISKIAADDINGISLMFVANLLPTKAGGMYLCNWQGHGKSSLQSNPQLVELDANNKIIWSLNDNTSFGMISSVSVFEK